MVLNQRNFQVSQVLLPLSPGSLAHSGTLLGRLMSVSGAQKEHSPLVHPSTESTLPKVTLQ